MIRMFFGILFLTPVLFLMTGSLIAFILFISFAVSTWSTSTWLGIGLLICCIMGSLLLLMGCIKLAMEIGKWADRKVQKFIEAEDILDFE